MKRLIDINKAGTTVIVVTHEHELVRAFGGRVIIIDGGEIKEDKLINGSDTIGEEYTDISDQPAPSVLSDQQDNNNGEADEK